jgi:outer membrane biogenesis lipoprotein LolB
MVESGAQDQHVSGQFRWTESVLASGSPRSHVALYTPLGDTLATVTVIDEFAELRTPDRSEYGRSAEELILRTLDLAVPVTGLRWWMRGRDEHGKQLAPQEFDEQGWHISYPQMEGARPRMLRLQREKPQRIDLRMVIDDWDGTP